MRTFILKLILLSMALGIKTGGNCQAQDSLNTSDFPSEDVMSRLDRIEEISFTLSANYKKSVDSLDTIAAQQSKLNTLIILISFLLLVVTILIVFVVIITTRKKSGELQEIKASISDANQSLFGDISKIIAQTKVDSTRPNQETSNSLSNKSSNSEPFIKHTHTASKVVFIQNPENFIKNKLEYIKNIDELTLESTEWILSQDFIKYDTPEYLIATQIVQKFLKSSIHPQQIRWRGVLTALEKGVILDEILNEKVQGIKEERQKLEQLGKPFYQEFLKPYISNSMILFEELRNFHEFVEDEHALISQKHRSEVSKLFSDQRDHLMKQTEKLLGLKINYAPMCVTLKNFSKFAEASRETPISPYFSAIVSNVQKSRKGLAGDAFIVEIESLSTNSEYETQQPPKTIVKAI